MKTIAYEVDMQEDFMRPEGRLYVPDAAMIRPTIKQVVDVVLSKGLRRLRSMDRHFADDAELMRNGGPFPDHCMDRMYGHQNPDGTYGVDFIPELQAGRAIAVENKTGEGNQFRRYSLKELRTLADATVDLVIEKQHYDAFTNPALLPLLRTMQVERAIVYGVATDYCDKAAVLGLQSAGIQTFVVREAIKGITPEGTAQAMQEMEAAGAKFISVRDLEALLR